MTNLPAYPKSYRGAMQQIDRLIRRYRRDYASGAMFGFDWPTMNANAPDIYRRIRDLQKDFARVEGMPR